MNTIEVAEIIGSDNTMWTLEVTDESIKLYYEDDVESLISFIPGNFDTYYTVREFLKTHTANEIIDSLASIVTDDKDLVNK
jgi:hypothetical protein